MTREHDVTRLYERQALKFDEFAARSFTYRYVERPAHQKHLRSICQKHPIALDLGCGGGRITRLLEEEGVRQHLICGVDNNFTLLSRAEKRQPNATFWRQDLRRFTGLARKFEVVTCNMVLHAFDNEDMLAILRHAYGVTATGGTLFFVVTHPKRQVEYTSEPPEARIWIDVTSPWDTAVLNFHRPVCDYIAYTGAAGFQVDVVEQLRIPESARLEAPARYHKYAQHEFIRLAIRASKVGA